MSDAFVTNSIYDVAPAADEHYRQATLMNARHRAAISAAAY